MCNAHVKLVEGVVLLNFQKVNRAPRELSSLVRNAQLLPIVKVLCDKSVEKEEDEEQGNKELPAEVEGAEKDEERDELEPHSDENTQSVPFCLSVLTAHWRNSDLIRNRLERHGLLYMQARHWQLGPTSISRAEASSVYMQACGACCNITR